MERTPSYLSKTCSRRIFSYCDKESIKVESVNSGDKPSLVISGPKANKLKNEAGKHVVQRYPPTENKGRRHTSTISVSVTNLTENRFELKDKDIITKTQRGHGKGGQHQNTTDSAVRMTHKPTKLTVFINGRDQHKNKREARLILESKVKQYYQEKEKTKASNIKRDQVDYGTRSNKIRTYNFINSRVVDHRTGNKTSKIKKVMSGDLNLIL